MKEKLKEIAQIANQEIEEVVDLNYLNEIRVKYLGKKGELTAVLRMMGSLSKEERPKIGELVNKLRDDIEEKI